MNSAEPEMEVQTDVDANETASMRRAVHLVIILVVLEAAAYAISRMAPAMAALMRPIYVLLIVLFAYPIWHASRHRTGHDRRRQDRRNHTSR